MNSYAVCGINKGTANKSRALFMLQTEGHLRIALYRQGYGKLIYRNHKIRYDNLQNRNDKQGV